MMTTQDSTEFETLATTTWWMHITERAVWEEATLEAEGIDPAEEDEWEQVRWIGRVTIDALVDPDEFPFGGGDVIVTSLEGFVVREVAAGRPSTCGRRWTGRAARWTTRRSGWPRSPSGSASSARPSTPGGTGGCSPTRPGRSAAGPPGRGPPSRPGPATPGGSADPGRDDAPAPRSAGASSSPTKFLVVGKATGLDVPRFSWHDSPAKSDRPHAGRDPGRRHGPGP